MVRKKPLNLIILILLLFASESYSQVTSFAIDSSKFNKKLMKILDTIHNNDQAGRQKLSVLIKNNASKVAKDSLWRRIRETDREDLKKVALILDKYGWQGPQDVGMDASETLFLVIQHADLATQQKYLPVVRDAEKKGKRYQVILRCSRIGLPCAQNNYSYMAAKPLQISLRVSY